MLDVISARILVVYSSIRERCTRKMQPIFRPGCGCVGQISVLLQIWEQIHVSYARDFYFSWPEGGIRLSKSCSFLAVPLIEKMYKKFRFLNTVIFEMSNGWWVVRGDSQSITEQNECGKTLTSGLVCVGSDRPIDPLVPSGVWSQNMIWRSVVNNGLPVFNFFSSLRIFSRSQAGSGSLFLF